MPYYDQRILPMPLPTDSVLRQDEGIQHSERPKKSFFRHIKEISKAIRNPKKLKKKLFGRFKKTQDAGRHPYMQPRPNRRDSQTSVDYSPPPTNFTNNEIDTTPEHSLPSSRHANHTTISATSVDIPNPFDTASLLSVSPSSLSDTSSSYFTPRHFHTPSYVFNFIQSAPTPPISQHYGMHDLYRCPRGATTPSSQQQTHEEQAQIGVMEDHTAPEPRARMERTSTPTRYLSVSERTRGCPVDWPHCVPEICPASVYAGPRYRVGPSLEEN